MLILKVLFRSAFRNKLRTSLTILGITIAILAFGLLRTLISAWYAGVEASSATRLVTRNSVSIVFPLPHFYKNKIQQVNGVKTVSYGTWFGGVYGDEKNFFANFAVEPRSFLELYPEFIIPPDGKEAFLKDQKGCVIGKKLAAKFGWKIGDIITLKGTIFLGNWDFVVRAIYLGRDKDTDESQFFFHWDYLNEIVKKSLSGWADQVGYYIIGVARPELAGDVAVAIDQIFKNSLAETLTETEKAFQQGFIAMSGAIVTAIQIVSFVVIFIIMAVVANTMAMTTRERIGEYAILKTLGFGGGHITALIFGESLVITIMGCLLGVVLTFPATKILSHELGTYFPVFNIGRETLLLNLVAALTIAFVSAIIPTRRAIKIRIADGLRRIG
ncbi:MAG: ABC transporter ATP-binding protein [Deltaproteobacteria bacterium CG_4_8_14_3_um_filter_45_9]|nr:MAG: ABC transporter ATP-binding protein [Deltaproteobacteria bacterium CG03_land_8_20_14_0_80_45_14]PIX21421.1 MAG: ABC transporter ATP-binding protein [Deltaproteobacteria bacterium CG_4_8_14_3_um_filter_45_9]